PGELFVEYQLAAKAERPYLFVAMAAYGDYGPFYIGDAKAYEQGGYEANTSPVTAEAEPILMNAIRQLLHDSPAADNIGSVPEMERKQILENMQKVMGELPERSN